MLAQNWLYLHRRAWKIASDGGGTSEWSLADGLAPLEQGKEAEAGRDHMCILVRGSKLWTLDHPGLQICPLSNDWFKSGFSELSPGSDLGELIDEGREGEKSTLLWGFFSPPLETPASHGISSVCGRKVRLLWLSSACYLRSSLLVPPLAAQRMLANTWIRPVLGVWT